MAVARPTTEEAQKVLDRWEKTKERVDKLVEKKIDPVYFELAGKYAAWLKESKYMPWILEQAMNVDAAKLCLALPDPYRDPSWGREHLGVTEQFAKELDLDKETADRYLQELFEKGLTNPTRNGYQRLRNSQNLHRLNTSSPKHLKSMGSDIVDMILIWTRIEMQQFRAKAMDTGKESVGEKLPDMGMGMGMLRPRWKAIKDLPGVLSVEDVREVFKAHERFAVLPCVCMQDDRERTCSVTLERCLTFDRSAEYVINRGSARELTLKEIFEVYDEMGKYPLIHLSGFGKDPKEVSGFCTCHWDCCLAMTHYYLPGSKHEVTDWLKKSRFRAVVDSEKCIGCGRCVEERCQFGAAQMKYYPEFGVERAYIDEEKCMGCGFCVETCTIGARGMKIVEPPEYVTEAKAGGAVAGGAVAVEALMETVAREKAVREEK